jgi:hypothetical protein
MARPEKNAEAGGAARTTLALEFVGNRTRGA